MTNTPNGASTSIPDEERRVWPSEIYPYRAGIIGGFLGGIAMALVAVLTVPLIGRGFWFPINLVAATVLRDLQTYSPEALDQFMPLAFVTGLLIHLIMATIIGTVFALLLPTLPGPPMFWSLVTGPILWAVVQFVILPVVNPIMSTYVNPWSFVLAHFLYSLVLGSWVMRYPKVPVSQRPSTT